MLDPMLQPRAPKAQKFLRSSCWKAATSTAGFVLLLVLLLIALAGCARSARAQVPPEIEGLTSETWSVDVVAAGTTATGDWYLQYADFLGGIVDGTGYLKNEALGCPWFSTNQLAQSADSVLAGLAPYDSASLWVRRTECVSSFRAVVEDSLSQMNLGALPIMDPIRVPAPEIRLTDWDAMKQEPVYLEIR